MKEPDFKRAGAEVDFKLTLPTLLYKSFPTSVTIVNLMPRNAKSRGPF